MNVYTGYFVSRNKDNENVKDFKQRRKTFCFNSLTGEPPQELKEKFQDFVSKGVKGETSRFYISVNARDKAQAQRDFACFLVQNPDFDPTRFNAKWVSCLDKRPLEKKWLFDFDESSLKSMLAFSRALEEYLPKEDFYTYATMNGFHFVAKHGFDSRELMAFAERKGWDVSLKRDAKRLFKSAKKD